MTPRLAGIRGMDHRRAWSPHGRLSPSGFLSALIGSPLQSGNGIREGRIAGRIRNLRTLFPVRSAMGDSKLEREAMEGAWGEQGRRHYSHPSQKGKGQMWGCGWRRLGAPPLWWASVSAEQRSRQGNWVTTTGRNRTGRSLKNPRVRRAFSPSFWTFRRGGPSSFRRRPSRNRSKSPPGVASRKISGTTSVLSPTVRIFWSYPLSWSRKRPDWRGWRLEDRLTAGTVTAGGLLLLCLFLLPAQRCEDAPSDDHPPLPPPSPMIKQRRVGEESGKREKERRVEDAECGGDRKPKSLRGSTFRLSRWKSLRSEKNPSTPAEAVLHISTILELGRRDDRDRRPVLRSWSQFGTASLCVTWFNAGRNGSAQIRFPGRKKVTLPPPVQTSFAGAGSGTAGAEPPQTDANGSVISHLGELQEDDPHGVAYSSGWPSP